MQILDPRGIYSGSSTSSDNNSYSNADREGSIDALFWMAEDSNFMVYDIQATKGIFSCIYMLIAPYLYLVCEYVICTLFVI
jgi:hypothetical protein